MWGACVWPVFLLVQLQLQPRRVFRQCEISSYYFGPFGPSTTFQIDDLTLSMNCSNRGSGGSPLSRNPSWSFQGLSSIWPWWLRDAPAASILCHLHQLVRLLLLQHSLVEVPGVLARISKWWPFLRFHKAHRSMHACMHCNIILQLSYSLLFNRFAFSINHQPSILTVMDLGRAV